MTATMTPDMELRQRRFSIQCKKLGHDWDIVHNVISTLPDYRSEAEPEGALLHGLLTITHSILPKKLGLTSEDIRKMYLDHSVHIDYELLSDDDVRLVSAGLAIALEFHRLETACDFLTFFPNPRALVIVELLHRMRLSMQHRAAAINGSSFEKWFLCVEMAIARCSEWSKLRAGHRFYAHEVMTGRVIKLTASLGENLRRTLLGSLSGTLDEEDISRALASERGAVASLGGEITLPDLHTRICNSAVKANAPVVALSLYISYDFVSYYAAAAYPWGISCSESGVLEAPDVYQGLNFLLAERNEFDFSHENFEDVVGWPASLRSLLQHLFQKFSLLNCPERPYILLSINPLFQGLPWQQLVAMQAGYDGKQTSSVALKAFPLVSILPNFGIALTRPTRLQADEKNTFICFPALGSQISDPIVHDAVYPVSELLRQFSDGPPFSLAYYTAHGPEETEEADISPADRLVLPKIFDGETMIGGDQLDLGLVQSVVFFGICGLGGPRPALLNDAGGVLRPFLAQGHGIMFAPIGDVYPEETATLGANILKSESRDDVINGYAQALLENPACFMYNSYGFPHFDTLAAEEQLSGSIDG